MSNLKLWINPIYLNKTKQNEIREKFQKSKPFPHISLDNFLIEEKANLLLKSLKEEKYYLEENDLYQFLRTKDFKNTKNKIIIEFREFLLQKETIEFFEYLTKSKINKNNIDLHSLKLVNTNYLLCHDDRVLGRQFAFIFNFNKNWNKENGGEFEIFNSDSNNNVNAEIIKSIIPKFNRFNLFKVQENSFHQINEVTTDKERITIGGWYHK